MVPNTGFSALQLLIQPSAIGIIHLLLFPLNIYNEHIVRVIIKIAFMSRNAG